MNILVIAPSEERSELKDKFGNSHAYLEFNDYIFSDEEILKAEVIFDFLIDQSPENIDVYRGFETPVFVNAPKLSLKELEFIYGAVDFPLFGFNGLRTFINRPRMEISTVNDDDKALLSSLVENLATDYLLVDDRVGMVTPRVLCMIINEAFYTVMEGTATREDIDSGMKLGTNYPMGPFEWCAKIGLNHVFELLEAIHTDTNDPRYKICPLLKKEYLNQ